MKEVFPMEKIILSMNTDGYALSRCKNDPEVMTFLKEFYDEAVFTPGEDMFIGRIPVSVLRSMDQLAESCNYSMRNMKKCYMKKWKFPESFEQVWSVYESFCEAKFRHFSSALAVGVVLAVDDISNALLAYANLIYERDKARLGPVHLDALVEAGYISASSQETIVQETNQVMDVLNM